MLPILQQKLIILLQISLEMFVILVQDPFLKILEEIEISEASGVTDLTILVTLVEVDQVLETEATRIHNSLQLFVRYVIGRSTVPRLLL